MALQSSARHNADQRWQILIQQHDKPQASAATPPHSSTQKHQSLPRTSHAIEQAASSGHPYQHELQFGSDKSLQPFDQQDQSVQPLPSSNPPASLTQPIHNESLNSPSHLPQESSTQPDQQQSHAMPDYALQPFNQPRWTIEGSVSTNRPAPAQPEAQAAQRNPPPPANVTQLPMTLPASILGPYVEFVNVQDDMETQFQRFMAKRKEALETVQKFARRDSAQNSGANGQGSGATGTVPQQAMPPQPSTPTQPIMLLQEPVSIENMTPSSAAPTPGLTETATPAAEIASPPTPTNKDQSLLLSAAASAQAQDDKMLFTAKALAHNWHLCAWSARLGKVTDHPPFITHSPKTTTLACLTIRDLLRSGDPVTGLAGSDFPKKAAWEALLKNLQFAFNTYTHAIDFLSFLGTPSNAFGSPYTRVQISKLVRTSDRICLEATHAQSVASQMNPFAYDPPGQQCGCVQEVLMWQRCANQAVHSFLTAREYEAADRRSMARATALKTEVRRAWEMLNWPGSSFGVSERSTVWPAEKDAKAVSRVVGGKLFKFFWLKMGLGEGREMVTIAVLGPFAELL